MAEIQLKNLTKRWGSFVGVDNFNLTIHDEEFLVLLGPSGCGKTTTMRMIAGLEDVTEGEVIIDGKIVNGLEPKDRDVAMVFQSYALYPNMNVYENIRFPLKVRKIDRKHHDEHLRFAKICEKIGETSWRAFCVRFTKICIQMGTPSASISGMPKKMYIDGGEHTRFAEIRV